MQNFQLLYRDLDVQPIYHSILRQPDLWDTHRWRTTYQGSPHAGRTQGRGVSDIWLRYADIDKTSDPTALTPVIEDIAPVFYDAWARLPLVRPLVLDLMHRVGGMELGRVLITKLPPGGEILAHADADGAYVDAGARYHVVLQGLPGSLYHCGDETVQMLTGEIWWFNHKSVHAVQNNSADDRVHLLVDYRIAP